MRSNKANVKKHRIRQYIIAGLLTMAVTAAAIGAVFGIRRILGNTGIGPNGSVEVKQSLICAASMYHSAWIREGKLYIAGEPFENQEAVDSWKRLVQVSVSDNHLVALDHTGQVYAIGNNIAQQCEVDAHQMVVSVAAGLYCTAVVLVDGEVLVYGIMDENERAGLLSETAAAKVVLSEDHAVVLRKDGTAAAYGNNEEGQCKVQDWKNLADIAVGRHYTVGVTKKGEVLFTGADYNGQAQAASWRGITQIAAGTGHVLGLKKDGTVVAAGRNNSQECEVGDWEHIVAVAAGYSHSIGLDENGNFCSVGFNGSGQRDVSGTGWDTAG